LRRVQTSEERISALWDRTDPPSNIADWSFWRHFAAACLSDRDTANMMEQVSIQELICNSPENGGLSVVERLLVGYDSELVRYFSA
jgi:hypothetical protein